MVKIYILKILNFFKPDSDCIWDCIDCISTPKLVSKKENKPYRSGCKENNEMLSEITSISSNGMLY